MNWIKQINEAMSYIEAHLADEISYDEVAKLAGCSVYNFQRMFSYIADFPLSEYIRNRRLTQAAFDVLRTDERIIDIALKYGYDSQDSFSRAFRKFHGVLPSVARKQTTALKSCPQLSFQVTVKGANSMKYQIEKWPAFKVAGYVYKVNTEKAFEVIPNIWEKCMSDGTNQKLFDLLCKTDYRPSGFLGIATGGQKGKEEEMEYIIGITNHVDVADCAYVPAPKDMKEFTYPAATWVIISTEGDTKESVQSIYKHFYSEWLPSSGYALANLPTIECYMDVNGQEVWFAIEE